MSTHADRAKPDHKIIASTYNANESGTLWSRVWYIEGGEFYSRGNAPGVDTPPAHYSRAEFWDALDDSLARYQGAIYDASTRPPRDVVSKTADDFLADAQSWADTYWNTCSPEDRAVGELAYAYLDGQRAIVAAIRELQERR